MADPAHAPRMMQGLASVARGVALMAHVPLSRAAPALDAPLTELAVWTLRAGADRAQFQDELERLHGLLRREVPEMVDGGWGAAVEDERVFVVVLGWESVEVRGVVFVVCAG